MKWIRSVFQELQENSLSEESLQHYLLQYQQAQHWLDLPDVSKQRPIPASKRQWIELFADLFHHEQHLTGEGVSESHLLIEVQKGDEESEQPWKPTVGYQVALDNLRSAFNVGSIFRVCDAVGFQGVITGGMTPGIEKLQVAKTSMGTAQWIPEFKAPRLLETLTERRAQGYSIIGLETVADAPMVHQFVWPTSGIIVLGNEEYGISEAVLRDCDHFVQLPMWGRKNSVNVANAFAVVAFHVATQLQQKPC